MQPELLLSVRNNYLPPVIGSRFIILCAIKNTDGTILTTGLTITYQILKGNVSIEQIDNKFIITCNQLSDVIIEFLAFKTIETGLVPFSTEDSDPTNQIFFITEDSTVGNETIFVTELPTQSTAYYSFKVTAQSYSPQVQDYQLMLNSEMPGDFLDMDSLDSTVWAQGAINSYNYVNETFKNIYPNSSTNINWLYSLWSQQQPLYFNNVNFKYEDLFVFLRNLRVSCTLNPFDIAWHISYFIYLVSGLKVYVYVDETRNTGISPPADYTVYILVVPSSQWVLDVSLLGVNTVLGGLPNLGPLIPTINFFIAKIYRSSRNYNVDYSQSTAGLGLNTILDNVYKGDINLNRTYCIAYEPNNFTLAKARIF